MKTKMKPCPHCGHPVRMHAKKKGQEYGCQWMMVDATDDYRTRITKSTCPLSRKEVKDSLRNTKQIASIISGMECKFDLVALKACSLHDAKDEDDSANSVLKSAGRNN